MSTSPKQLAGSARGPTYTAFEGTACLATGTLEAVSVAAKQTVERDPTAGVLAFEDRSGSQIDLELHGTVADVRARAGAGPRPAVATASSTAKRGPGRPKLGVVSKEVTLLPRHWAWLAVQRGGASATLRRLVDEARRAGEGAERTRRAQDAAYRFMKAMAGNRPGYEEANRALFRGDAERFAAETAAWPKDIRQYALKLAAPAFEAVASSPGDEEREEP